MGRASEAGSEFESLGSSSWLSVDDPVYGHSLLSRREFVLETVRSTTFLGSPSPTRRLGEEGGGCSRRVWLREVGCLEV